MRQGNTRAGQNQKQGGQLLCDCHISSPRMCGLLCRLVVQRSPSFQLDPFFFPLFLYACPSFVPPRCPRSPSLSPGSHSLPPCHPPSPFPCLFHFLCPSHTVRGHVCDCVHVRVCVGVPHLCVCVYVFTMCVCVCVCELTVSGPLGLCVC